MALGNYPYSWKKVPAVEMHLKQMFKHFPICKVYILTVYFRSHVYIFYWVHTLFIQERHTSPFYVAQNLSQIFFLLFQIALLF